MPAAIDKEIIFAIGPSDDTSKLIALNFNESFEIDIKNPQPVSTPPWANYLLGVVRQLVDRKIDLKPFVCVFGGNIPSGSGLSSSAALEGGFAFALHELNSMNLPKIELAKIGYWSEHNFVGVRCGIMDQFANMMGKENRVIRLDCRSMEYQYLPIQLDEYSIVLLNSGVKHSLASSEYNVRRSECEEGVTILKKKNAFVKSLRDVSLKMLEDSRSDFSNHVYNRCRYVIEEIERVQLASADLQMGDLHSFGSRMFETHDGLARLYDVSCVELDFLVSCAQQHHEVLGARLMGGGFGGCTINIIQKGGLNRIVNEIRSDYQKKFKLDIESYLVHLKDGTGMISA
jgi:galactokinase